MTFLPIVERELRVAARRQSTYLLRLLMATAAIFVAIFFFVANWTAPTPMVARRIFNGLSVLALIYCLASGRRSTADCLSEEKREGTLGLLFLTDLKGYDIILGKLFATSLSGFIALLAILPVLAVPLLMGGTSNAEFWRMVLVLVNAFLLSLAIGVFSSVLSWNARHALGRNFLLLILITVLPPACAGLLAYLSSSPLTPQLLFSCPLYSLYLSADDRYKWEARHFWASLGVIHVLTWVLLALASRLVVGCWQDQPSASGKRPWRDRWENLVYGNALRRKAWRKRLLDINPFYWLASRSRLKPLGVWMALAFIACWWLYMRWVARFNWFEESFALTTGFILNCLLKLWIAVEATHRLAEEQKLSALELLLSTPLSVARIVRGQLLALRRQFLIPLLAIIFVELFLVIEAAQRSYSDTQAVLVLGIGSLVMLLMDLLALVGLGMSAALSMRTPNRAIVSTVSQVLILPFALWMTAIIVIRFFSMGAGMELGWRFYFGLWFGLGLLADAGFAFPAWWRLCTGFRQLASERSFKPLIRR